MIAPEQAGAGVALAAALAMLCTARFRAGFFCFAIQSASVAAVAIADRQLWLLPAPALLAAAIWRLRGRSPAPARVAGLKAGVIAGAILTVLCLSQDGFGIPLALVLLPMMLAATRRDPVMRLLAAGAMANGIALTGCLVAGDDLLPLACLALPLPMAASLPWGACGLIEASDTRVPGRIAPLLEWAETAGAGALFVATLTVPLGALASVFAPLIAFDGVVRARAGRAGGAPPPGRSLVFLLKLGLVLLAVCVNDPILSWLAVAAAATASMLAAGTRDRAVLAAIGAGLALFGLLTLPVEASLPAYFGLFAGFAVLAAAVPDLAIPLLVLLLRFADQAEWLPEAGPLGMGVAMIALLACSALLMRRRRPPADILLLAQASIAGLAIGTLQADGRFAAAVLLILLSLTRTAARAAGEPASLLSIAGLAGLPPLGVFPGLVLVVLVIGSHVPWLLLPAGLALAPIMLAGLPRRIPRLSPRAAMLSIGWLPLALALLFGWFAPADLVRWLAGVTMGPS
nr:hypothetical protein [uncultured Rhodopila sp.]